METRKFAVAFQAVAFQGKSVVGLKKRKYRNCDIISRLCREMIIMKKDNVELRAMVEKLRKDSRGY